MESVRAGGRRKHSQKAAGGGGGGGRSGGERGGLHRQEAVRAGFCGRGCLPSNTARMYHAVYFLVERYFRAMPRSVDDCWTTLQ